MKIKTPKFFSHITHSLSLACFKLHKTYKPSLLSSLKIENLKKKSVYSPIVLVIFLVATALVVSFLGTKTSYAAGVTKYPVIAGGNWSADATWTLNADGTANATTKPTAADAVIMNSTSGAVTIDATANCLTLTQQVGTTAVLTHGTGTLNVYGNITLLAGKYVALASSELYGITPQVTSTLTTGGNAMGRLNITSSGGVLTLGDNYTGRASQTSTFIISAGSINLNGKTVSGDSAINRLLIQSSVVGTPKGITMNGGTFAYADFQDIAFTNGADLHLEAITGLSGDCGGNTLVGGYTLTFTAPTTQTFASTGGSWSNVAKWTSRIPLPQDLARFQAMSAGQTITVDMPSLPDMDFSGATNAPTVTLSTSGLNYTFYGSVNLTGATYTSNQLLWFSARTNATLTSNGQVLGNRDVTITMPGATLTFADAMSTTGAISLTAGTLASGFNVTATRFASSVGTTLTRSGNPLWTLTGSGATWAGAGTITVGTATISLTYAGASAVTFAGGTNTFKDIIITPGSGIVTFSGAFTFANMTMASAGAKTVKFTKNTTYTMTGTNFLSGSATGVVTITSDDGVTAATLNKPNGVRVGSNYLDITVINVTPATTWYYGNNSVWHSGTGWNAGAPPAATAPDAPTIGTATSGNASASVTFTPPNNGGSPITGYTVTSTPESHTGTGSVSPVTVSGLTNYTSYTFTVHATNAIGNSAESAASNAVIPDIIPIAPTNAAIGNIGTTTFDTTWTDNSSNETGFKVYISTTSNANCSLATYPGAPEYTPVANATTQAVAGKIINSQYCAKVVATNAIGDSVAYSAPKYTIVNQPNAPAVTTASTTALTIVIDANSNPASTEFAIFNQTTGQYIQFDSSSGASPVWQTRSIWGSDTGVTNTGLTINTNYNYQIKARNGDNVETAFSAGTSNSTLADASGLPMVAGNYKIAQKFLHGDAHVLLVGDSISVGLAGYYPHAWRVDQWAGFTAGSSFPQGQDVDTMAAPVSLGTLTSAVASYIKGTSPGVDSVDPDNVPVNLFPSGGDEFLFSSNGTDPGNGTLYTNRLYSIGFNAGGLNNVYRGNWLQVGAPLHADTLYFANPLGAANITMQTPYDTYNAYTSSAISAYAASAGLSTIPLTFTPTANNTPVLHFRLPDDGYTPVAGTNFVLYGVHFYTGQSGFQYASIAEGGKNTNFYTNTANVSDANLTSFMNFTDTNIAYIMLGANGNLKDDNGNTDDSQSNYEHQTRKLIARYKAAKPGMQFVLVSPYQTYNTEENTRIPDQAQALYNISQSDPDVVFLNNLKATGSYASHSQYLADGTHPNAAGAIYFTGISESLLEQAQVPLTATVTAPTEGATVSGSVNLSASATSNNSTVAGMQFKLDGANIGSEGASNPYSIAWDSTTVANGSHTITAVARDASGNSATSSAVTFTVNNAAPTPEPTPTPTPAESSTSTPATPSGTTTTPSLSRRLSALIPGTATSSASFVTIPTDLTNIEVGQTITFDASSSGSNIVKYEWDFGDGITSNEMKVEHKYNNPGRYTVTLAITDKSGNKSTVSKTIDIRPPAPTITNIKADGTSIVFEGKSFPKATVNLTIHSNPYTGQTVADKDGKFSYTLENGSETIGEGGHTVLANATIILSDNSELTSKDSKTYDFNVSVDNGKLKVEMGKTKTWKYIALGLGVLLLLGIGFVLVRTRKRKR